jgi:hypothetical protein
MTTSRFQSAQADFVPFVAAERTQFAVNRPAESIPERQEGVELVINDLSVDEDDEGPQVAYPPRSG